MKTKIVFLSCFLFLCAISANAQQQTKASPVATVNLYNAAIANQSSSGELTIAFDISNRDNVQSQVKYSVNLFDKDKKSSIDQKIYDEELTLGINETVSKKITYTPPQFLKGSYEVYMEMRNKDGLSLGYAYVGDVLLNGDGKYVYIDPNSCYVTIEGGGEDQKKYTLTQGVDVNEKENIIAHCDLDNRLEKAVAVTPSFASFYRSIFGDLLENKDLRPISLAQGEKISRTFVIPKMKEAQSYDAVLFLKNSQGTAVSNKVIFHYVIQGSSATVQNIKLDKQSYQKGETAKVSFAFTGSVDNFAGSRAGVQEDFSIFHAKFKISNSDGSKCADEIERKIKHKGGGDFEFGMPIIATCKNPVLSVAISDDNGKVLVEREYKMGNGEEKRDKNYVPAKSIDYKLVGMGIAIVLLVMGILLVIFKKSRRGFGIFVFICVYVCGGLFLVMSEVSADTWSSEKVYRCESIDGGIYCGGCSWVSGEYETYWYCPENYWQYFYSASLSKASYNPNEQIVVRSGAYAYTEGALSAACGNCCHAESVETDITGTINGVTKRLNLSDVFVAESAAGPHYAVFNRGMVAGEDFFGTYHTDGGSIEHKIPYSVVAVNGACGVVNGGSFSTLTSSQPGLCVSGNTVVSFSGTGPWTWSCTGNGVTANCSANKTTVNGACGTANGTTVSSAPTTNLCAVGSTATPVPVTGSGPWSWNCNGSGPGSIPASCSANKTCVPSYICVPTTFDCSSQPCGSTGTTFRTCINSCTNTPVANSLCGASCVSEPVTCPACPDKGKYREVYP